MDKTKIRELISHMSLEEKAGLCSGADFWRLKGIERLGIPSVMVADGPHGLRKQKGETDHLGINDSIKAVCFPAGCATASSFDRDLVRRLGETIGEECRTENIAAILGPAMNIKRSPLCGRNFEYYSEDPLVSSELASAMIEGVQSTGVGTSAKHFFANNQEYRRMTNSSEVDERTLREIYLASFEGAVKKAQPKTIMSSYNRVNGEYVGDNSLWLTDVLRREWGFEGLVVSDWGGVNDRVQSLAAGLDLEMPASGGINDALIVDAVRRGLLDVSVLNTACERILEFIFGSPPSSEGDAGIDYERDHERAATFASECIVLLKNEDKILPLFREQKIAVIGKYAEAPRFQGGGSSHINCSRVESALESLKETANIVYARGFDDEQDIIDEGLQQEAVRMASEAEAAVIFAGLPDSFESEGYDRRHLNLPDCQNALIERILSVQKNVIVVLHNGSPVAMPWKDRVKGIIEAYLGGQAVGRAVADVLYGRVNPSGRLAETFPLKVEDTPCYLSYGRGKDRAFYTEGVFVGYRYYTAVKRETLFPFGFGLSYTEFSYRDLMLDRSVLTDGDQVIASVCVKNAGTRAGKEVVQLYVSPPQGHTPRPVRELRGFDKIALEAGEEKEVRFTLDSRAFAYWNEEIHDWYIEDGKYCIQIGRHAEQVELETEIRVKSTRHLPRICTMNTCVSEVLDNPAAHSMLKPLIEKAAGMMGGGSSSPNKDAAVNENMLAAMLEDMPLRQLISFVPGVKREDLVNLIEYLNSQL